MLRQTVLYRCLIFAGLVMAIHVSTLSPALAGGPDPMDGSSPPTESTSHTSDTLGVTFETPAEECEVREETFPTDTPAHKIKFSLSIVCQNRALVRLDMWTDSARLALDEWFSLYLGFLDRTGHPLWAQSVTRYEFSGIVIEEPRSPHALARKLIVFRSDDKVYLVTLEQADTPFSQSLLDQMLTSWTLVPEVTP